jgi:NADH-ubiquinone oxidoreductase chain 6
MIIIKKITKNLNEIKWLLIITIHLVGFFTLLYLVLWIFSRLGFISNTISLLLFFFWKQIGSLILPTAIIFFSILVIINTNPIYSLVNLILVFLTTVFFLLSINVNFLAMIYLIIYVGAIAILFLFVIMMFNLHNLKNSPNIQPYWEEKEDLPINSNSVLNKTTTTIRQIWNNFKNEVFKILNQFRIPLFSKTSNRWFFFFFLLLFWFFTRNVTLFLEDDKYFRVFTQKSDMDLIYYLNYQTSDILLFGTLLYTYYSYLFLMAGLLLLTAMLGAIVLALSTTEEKQNR